MRASPSPASRTGLSAAASSRAATRLTASSSKATRWGEAAAKLLGGLAEVRNQPAGDPAEGLIGGAGLIPTIVGEGLDLSSALSFDGVDLGPALRSQVESELAGHRRPQRRDRPLGQA